SVSRRLTVVSMGTFASTYGPTPTHEESLKIAESEFAKAQKRLNELMSKDLPAIEAMLRKANAPWTFGQPVPGAPN
ncbi:MAG: hypothetical protein AAFV29_20100, partial [Myxococcota bacterium]